MATMTVIWWRDIPAQVTGRDGRRQSKIVLHPRFQVAIDKAASRAGKRAYNDYIEEWRRTQRPCGTDVDAEVAALRAQLATESAELDRLAAEESRGADARAADRASLARRRESGSSHVPPGSRDG